MSVAADPPAWLWVACTVAAAGVQTARNAAQRSLTGRLGTVGATHVRFLFGLPFGLLFLAGVVAATAPGSLRPSWSYAGWALMGAVFQILATALMLAAMRERSFVVSIAYVKTEPLQIALFGLIFLGERLGLQASAAVLVATAGVLLMSMPAGGAGVDGEGTAAGSAAVDMPGVGRVPRAALFGVLSGAMFALSAVGFRGAILALGDGPFYLRATTTLATSLAIQTALLTAWLLWRERSVLREILRLWRPSLLAGAAGALASQLWFLAFSLQAAAAVRTVGLVEIVFAQAVSQRLFAQGTTAREAVGMALMVGGVVWLLLAGP
ncbi:MAG: EamA/RhaT family transporter [Lautropia sp.]|nr:MAG: EamA/RhaT family transporter [Pseudomonadota bacterium]MBC6960972.1 EamA/RhaT family transporter [Lautropia sp.]MCL4701194.1 EamA family transporter [Burkholderiaceae bacterium]MCZ2413693.1 EamA family transporter [Burkholderiales bacterium]MDL1907626.1 EamA/RhaT family transporter [Betaproteobacteria bacterium PRO1]